MEKGCSEELKSSPALCGCSNTPGFHCCCGCEISLVSRLPWSFIIRLIMNIFGERNGNRPSIKSQKLCFCYQGTAVFFLFGFLTNTPFIVTNLWIISRVLRKLILTFFSRIFNDFMEEESQCSTMYLWGSPILPFKFLK